MIQFSGKFSISNVNFVLNEELLNEHALPSMTEGSNRNHSL